MGGPGGGQFGQSMPPRRFIEKRTASVAAIGETAPVGTASVDAADDPAIWRNRQRPSESLIVATDKKAGLYVYGLDGKRRSFDPAGLVNNVDLIDLGTRGILVAASDRNNLAAAKLRLYRLDPANGQLAPIGIVDGVSLIVMFTIMNGFPKSWRHP
jgi:3-phytase